MPLRSPEHKRIITSKPYFSATGLRGKLPPLLAILSWSWLKIMNCFVSSETIQIGRCYRSPIISVFSAQQYTVKKISVFSQLPLCNLFYFIQELSIHFHHAIHVIYIIPTWLFSVPKKIETQELFQPFRHFCCLFLHLLQSYSFILSSTMSHNQF